MKNRNIKKRIDKNVYLINGIYKKDVDIFFNELSKEELMVMIKRGFIGCDLHKCDTVKEPYVSYENYITLENVSEFKYKWENVQCPLHNSQNNKCEKIKLLNKYEYSPCEFLAHYLTGALVYTNNKI